MNYKSLRLDILKWYDSQKRDMPWRGVNDPYKIWVSEIMLQQTQVETVKAYYNKWIKSFPDVKSVAKAALDDILKHWEGLGYYSRARNFHESCKKIYNSTNSIPSDYDEFVNLKGVGPYIASAVLSIAYNKPLGVVDGNVNRVTSRLLADSTPPIKNKKRIEHFMSNVIDKYRPGDINQSVMDLGRYICKPKNPLCKICPLIKYCKAFNMSNPSNFPTKVIKRKKPHYEVAVGIIWNKNKLLITKRKADGFLGGLWEFPGGKIKVDENVETAIMREIKEELSICIEPDLIIKQIDHQYSHFSVTIQAINCRYKSGNIKLNGPVDFKWIEVDNLSSYAFPKASTKLFNSIETLS